MLSRSADHLFWIPPHTETAGDMQCAADPRRVGNLLPTISGAMRWAAKLPTLRIEARSAFGV